MFRYESIISHLDEYGGHPEHGEPPVQIRNLYIYDNDSVFARAEDLARLLYARLRRTVSVSDLPLQPDPVDGDSPALSTQSVLPNLTRVVIEPESPVLWAAQRESQSLNVATYRYYLPLVLINLPSVQFYCQQPIVSYLALAHNTFKISNPPKIVTYHVYYDLWSFRGYIVPAQRARVPIILGTTSRYMFENKWIVVEIDSETGLRVGELVSEGEIRRQLNPIISSIQRDTVVVKDDHRNTDIRDDTIASVSLDGTILELYGFVSWELHQSSLQTVITTSSPRPVSSETLEDHQQTYIAELDRVQNILDDMLMKEQLRKWKGKIVVKSDQDTVPCTACGLDLSQQKRSRAEDYEADMKDDARANRYSDEFDTQYDSVEEVSLSGFD